MRSTLVTLSLAVSTTVSGHWTHPKPALHPKRANESDHDASKACEEIKSQISSASEVIDGIGKYCASAEWSPWHFD